MSNESPAARFRFHDLPARWHVLREKCIDGDPVVLLTCEPHGNVLVSLSLLHTACDGSMLADRGGRSILESPSPLVAILRRIAVELGLGESKEITVRPGQPCYVMASYVADAGVICVGLVSDGIHIVQMQARNLPSVAADAMSDLEGIIRSVTVK